MLLFGQSVGWSVGRLVSRSVSQLVGQLAGWCGGQKYSEMIFRQLVIQTDFVKVLRIDQLMD